MRVVAWFGILMSCALASGHASAVQQPRPVATFDLSVLLPSEVVPSRWTRSIAFVSDSSIATGLCQFQVLHPYPHVSVPEQRSCSLTLIQWEDGILHPLAQTHQFSPSESIHLTSEARVLTTPFGKEPAILYSSDLSATNELPPLHYASKSGDTVAESTQGGWKLYHLDSKLHPIRGGSGSLQSISDEVVVFRDGDRIRTETLDGKALGFFRAKLMCSVQVAGHDSLFVSDCGRPRLVDYNGKERLRLRQPNGWSISQLNWSADGKRVLFDHFSRKTSVFRNAGEVLVAFASLGFGVGDEHDNGERVEVMDITTGNSCFDLRREFAENSESASQNAVLSPSGEFVAVVVGSTLSVYHLGARCEDQK
jgi:hypothetical protein